MSTKVKPILEKEFETPVVDDIIDFLTRYECDSREEEPKITEYSVKSSQLGTIIRLNFVRQ